jgi:hypothetical protein
MSVEDLPAKESMAIRHRNNDRSFNENLAPLLRWLEKQVGRPWDRVYSEACQVIKPTSTVKNHVKIHLLEMVNLKITMIDGRPCEVDRWGKWDEVGSSGWAGYSEIRDKQLYVNPQTRLLCKHKVRKRPSVKKTEWKLIFQLVISPTVHRATGLRTDHHALSVWTGVEIGASLYPQVNMSYLCFAEVSLDLARWVERNVWFFEGCTAG